MFAPDKPSCLLHILTTEMSLLSELVKNAPWLVYSNQPYVAAN